MLTKADLYEQDLYAWTQEQAALLQAGCFDRLDIPHLVEELQLMGGSERGELAKRLIVLLTHLLKLHIAAPHLPMDRQRAGASWRRTCRTQRLRIAKVLRRNPSLRSWKRLCPADARGGWSRSWMLTSGQRQKPHDERCSRAFV